MARSGAVGTVVFAVILTGWGVMEIVAAMVWAPGGWAYAAGSGLIAGGWLTARSLRRATWADDVGLRLRGMFRTHLIPWSHVRYIQARPDARTWVVEAGLADGTVRLPGMTGTDQAGAPLLCSSASTLAADDSARAVIIPLTGAHLSEWRLIKPGDGLRLSEGQRVCGHAVVRWSESTSLPVPCTDTDRFRAWANSGDDRPRPA